jgi:2-oxoglutarate ferredoxin oxidoreductase subunit alpha
VVQDARRRGIRVGGIKLKTLWPFPDFVFHELPSHVETIVVCEMNMGQIIGEVERACCGRFRVEGINNFSGTIITPGEIERRIERLV